jgi:nucleolar protein 6
MAKITAKNEKLSNERQRNHEKRDEIESKQLERKAKKEARQGTDGEVGGEAAAEEPDTGGIHPARLAMLAQPEGPQPAAGGGGGGRKFKPNLGNVPKWKGGAPRRY